VDSARKVIFLTCVRRVDDEGARARWDIEELVKSRRDVNIQLKPGRCGLRMHIRNQHKKANDDKILLSSRLRDE
jgi:hypothetical protein